MIDLDAQLPDTKYLIVRKSGRLYVITCPYDISLAHNQSTQTMDSHAVLIIDEDGDVIKNRYGPETTIYPF